MLLIASPWYFNGQVSTSMFLKLGVATQLCVANILLCVAKNTTVGNLNLIKDQINTYFDQKWYDIMLGYCYQLVKVISYSPTQSNNIFLVNLFCFCIYNIVCRKQKFGAKRCRSIKKVENHCIRGWKNIHLAIP